MSIVVFSLFADGSPDATHFTDAELMEALAYCQSLRASGSKHVCMSTQLDGQVGNNDKGGAVEEGKLPNGDPYQWSKAHRAGASRK